MVIINQWYRTSSRRKEQLINYVYCTYCALNGKTGLWHGWFDFGWTFIIFVMDMGEGY